MAPDQLDRLVAHVAGLYESTPERMLSRSRDPRDTMARGCCWYLLRRFARMPLAEMGAIFNRDHTTAHHGIRRFEQQLRADSAERELFMDAMAHFDTRGQQALRANVQAEVEHARAVLTRLEAVLTRIERAEQSMAPRRAVA